MIKSKIIMIGANLKGIETELKHNGIRCTELIFHCSPLSMIGARDENMVEISGRIDDMPTHLDIKKNLAQMLSKDPANFVQNYNSLPYGKTVDYSNYAEHIIISNTSLAYDLFSNGEYIYTAYSDNEFYQALEKNASYKKVNPANGGLDWRGLYLKFIETVMKEYDGRHIILIKTNLAKFYMDGSDIKQFGDEYDKIREMICEADRLFAEKTNCIEVDEAYNHIPTAFDRESVVPFAEFDDACVYNISRIIEDIIFKGIIPQKCERDFADINDIISFYNEYEESANKESFISKVKELTENKNALPIIKAKQVRSNNIDFLAGYTYISDSFKQIPNDERIYVGLGNNTFIVFEPDSETPVSKVVLPFCKSPDHDRVIKDGYACSIWESDALCGSLPFYIERARRGEGQHPIKISFSSNEEFYESLNYIDYPDLIENERFLIGLRVDEIDKNTHKVKCDFGFFFDPNVKICILDNGLSDQISHYVFAKRIEQHTGSEIYYDDLCYYLDYKMNDLEIDRMTKKDISEKLFSNIFTRRLLLNFRIGDVIPDKLAENGLHEITVIANNRVDRGDIVKKCNKICLCSIQYEYLDKILACGLYPLYFNYFIRPEWLMLMEPFELRDYLEFPKVTGKNKEIEEEMLGCDAVAIWVRRGDQVRLGWVPDMEFYSEALKKVSEIEDYSDMKYFVFSDDIPWVKKHSKEIGLEGIDGEVFYVDHYKLEDSLFVMYFISLAKVVIGSSSGFARTGALFGTRCENLICSTRRAVEMFEMIGRKNRHPIKTGIDFRPDFSNGITELDNARRKNQ